MPHLRKRHVLPQLIKKLRFSPVVAMQGARQTGKSVLARDILPATLKQSFYVTLDQFSKREFVQERPGVFLEQNADFRPLIIDEAQKAPNIFDEIKHSVDQKRRPCRFLLLGSTEFSKLSRIRESLTGRMSRLRLFPLTVSETLDQLSSTKNLFGSLTKRSYCQRAQLIKYLKKGGMPALFSVRDDSEWTLAAQDWLELTVHRDCQQFPSVKIDGELCYRILQQIAILEEPNAANLVKALKVNPRKLNTHLNVLQSLFVINALPPHSAGTGKTLFFLLDTGLAGFFCASFERQLHTLALSEILAFSSYFETKPTQISYYRGSRQGLAHLVLESAEGTVVIKILQSETFDKRELEILKSFRKKYSGVKPRLLAFGPERFNLKDLQIEVYPWENLAL
ncbi:MAG TPA: AAA family ATPase [bacterium]|nr:AAA family ATPase [bacterium]